MSESEFLEQLTGEGECKFKLLLHRAFGAKIQRVVMPLFAKVDGQPTPIGTGFIIGQDGLMMTAAHVILQVAKGEGVAMPADCANLNLDFLQALYISSERHGPNKDYFGGFWPIDRAWMSGDQDIALCWLRRQLRDGKPTLFPQMPMSPGLPKIGESIVGFGYHKMAGKFGDDQEKSNVYEYKQETAFSEGKILEVHPERRDAAMLKFPCFRTNARFDAGMSGGPIVNASGSVCGVICTSFGQPDERGEHCSYGALMWTALGIQIETASQEGSPVTRKTLYDLVKNGYVASDDSIERITVSIDANGNSGIKIS